MTDLAKRLTVTEIKKLLKDIDLEVILSCLTDAGMEPLEVIELVKLAIEDKTHTKIDMNQITILRSDGLKEKNLVFDYWEDVNALLCKLGDERDKESGYTGAYYKTEFEIQWQDGTVYTGRVDVNSKEERNLGKHVLEHLEFYTGEHCPAHMTEDDYNMMVRSDESYAQVCRDYIKTYNIVQ